MYFPPTRPFENPFDTGIYHAQFGENYWHDDASQFPIMVFPNKIKNAIYEVFCLNKAPVPLIASSALSALSMACQHLFDVVRPGGIKSPCSLFFITIADSGERKTSSDKFFTRPIRDFEASNIEKNREINSNYAIDMKIWRLREAALKKKVASFTEDSEESQEAEQQLREHYKAQPEKPSAMRMLFDDVSPTAIISSMHDQWPSVGIISDEAGKIFGSKTFENIGIYNKLWNGDSISLDRHRTANSYTVADGRLTVSLMAQQKTFRDFLEKQGILARDNGFLARCLISWPASTQGQRHIQASAAPDQCMPMNALQEFQRVIAVLLDRSWQNHQAGKPRRDISMSPDAAYAWNHYYNKIESGLGAQGWYADVRDGASKMAENIARLACLFQAFDSCESAEDWQISDRNVNAAEMICLWYMNNFKNIFGSGDALSEESKNASDLHAWLESTWQRFNNSAIKKNYILQFGPPKLRTKSKLDVALNTPAGRRVLSVMEFQSQPGRKPTLVVARFVDNNIYPGQIK